MANAVLELYPNPDWRNKD